jgi:hypothetical protein
MELRNRLRSGPLLHYEPQEVFRTNRDLAELLGELEEYRKASASASVSVNAPVKTIRPPSSFVNGADPEMLYGEPEKPERAIDFYSGQPVDAIPLQGTVS